MSQKPEAFTATLDRLLERRAKKAKKDLLDPGNALKQPRVRKPKVKVAESALLTTVHN